MHPLKMSGDEGDILLALACPWGKTMDGLTMMAKGPYKIKKIVHGTPTRWGVVYLE